MPKKDPLIAGLAGGLVAAAGNYALYFAARAAGVGFVGNFDGAAGSPLPVVAIGMSSIVPGLVAGLIVFGLGKLTLRPLRVFVPPAVLFAIVSLVPPMNMPSASLGTRLSLAAMHIVAAAAILGALVLRQRRTLEPPMATAAGTTGGAR